MKKILGITGLLLLFNACDCVQSAAGIIINKKTKQPIAGVWVYNYDKDHIRALTDSTGNFRLEGISGALIGCPAMTVGIQKDGYKTKRVVITNAGFRKIKLTPLKIK